MSRKKPHHDDTGIVHKLAFAFSRRDAVNRYIKLQNHHKAAHYVVSVLPPP